MKKLFLKNNKKPQDLKKLNYSMLKKALNFYTLKFKLIIYMTKQILLLDLQVKNYLEI